MKNDPEKYKFMKTLNCLQIVMSGLVGIMSTSLSLSFVVKDLLLGRLGPSLAEQAFGVASAKNSCRVLAI